MFMYSLIMFMYSWGIDVFSFVVKKLGYECVSFFKEL